MTRRTSPLFLTLIWCLWTGCGLFESRGGYDDLPLQTQARLETAGLVGCCARPTCTSDPGTLESCRKAWDAWRIDSARAAVIVAGYEDPDPRRMGGVCVMTYGGVIGGKSDLELSAQCANEFRSVQAGKK